MNHQHFPIRNKYCRINIQEVNFVIHPGVDREVFLHGQMFGLNLASCWVRRESCAVPTLVRSWYLSRMWEDMFWKWPVIQYRLPASTLMGFPRRPPLFSFFDNTLKHIFISTVSDLLYRISQRMLHWCCRARCPRSEENMHFHVVSGGERTTGFYSNKLYQPSRTEPDFSWVLRLYCITVIRLSYHIAIEWKHKMVPGLFFIKAVNEREWAGGKPV